MSSDLIWQLVGKNNCFRRTAGRYTFTAEPGNLTNLPSYRHSGFVRKGLSMTEGKHTVFLTTTNLKTRKASRAAKTFYLRKKAGYKHNSKALHNVLLKYRPELRKAAMKRLAILTKATRIAKSQKAHEKAAAPAPESK